MNRRNQFFLLLGCAVFGIAFGYLSAKGAKSSARALNANPERAEQGDRAAGTAGKTARSEENRFTHLVSVLRGNETLKGCADLYRALADVRSADIPGLLERAKKLPLKLRNELITALFEHWMEIDRPVAEAWIREGAHPYACYAAWARISPQEALNYCLSTSWKSPFWSAVPIALERRVGKDSRARLEVLANYPASSGRNFIIRDVFESWAASDPGSALAWAARLPDEKLRGELEKKGLTALAKVDPDTAASRVREMIPDLQTTMVGNGFVSDFTQGLAAKDLTIAREFVESLPPEFQFYPMVAVGSEWAKTDPVAALDWTLANGIDVTKWYRTESGGTAKSVMLAAMATDSRKTIDWLLSLPEGNQRDSWLQNVLVQDRVKFDREATRDIFDHLSTDRQLRLAPAFGRKFGGIENLAELPTWAAWIPDEAVRARAIGGALAGAFNYAPARVEAILAELPTGPVHDQALAALAWTQTSSAPSAAAARALTIQDQTVRYDALDRLMNTWMNRDHQTAETWLDAQTDLPREWVAEWRAIKPTP
jgi:hypothetical protein